MPSTIDTILSVFGQHNVQYLLMDGQACVIYGGAEFSRDTDLALLEDLVACKKTQRDKDWPMITRLVDVNYVSAIEGDLEITPTRSQFWLRELRTPDFLLDCVRRMPEMAGQVARTRPATAAAADAAFNAAAPHRIQELLDAEQKRERAADVIYWAPLRAELESLRHAAARGELAMGWPP